MRTSTSTFGLAAPLLLTFAFLAMAIPQAVAQTPTYTVHGVVLSDAGEPIVGADVNGYSYPVREDESRIASDESVTRGASDTTDEQGRFELSLPAGRGYISVYYGKWGASDSREIDIAGDTELSFTLKTPPPKTAIVEGRVLDVNGNPIEGAEVFLNDACCWAYDEPMPAETVSSAPAEGEGASSSGTTDPGVAKSSAMIAPDRCCWRPYEETQRVVTKADGTYRFVAYGGPRQLMASAVGYAQTTQHVELVDNQTIEADIILEKAPPRDAAVVGRVIDAKTGAPISNAQVNVRSLEWSRWAYEASAKDGAFRLLTVPGWAEISVSFYGYPDPIPLAEDGAASTDSIMRMPEVQYYQYTKLVKLASGQNPLDVQLQPRPQPGIALVGYVVDPDTKQAIAGATVNVWNQDTSDWGSAVTDATGSFRILVREGHFQANAWKDGYLGGSQSFVVSEEPTQRVDVMLPKGTQKWAPCSEGDDCGGPIYYREAAVAEGGSGVAKAVPLAAPAANAGSFAATEDASSTTDTQSSGFSAQTGRSATYAGSGGNLPPYDPGDSSVPAAQRTSAVPGVGVAFLVGALAAIALLARRK